MSEKFDSQSMIARDVYARYLAGADDVSIGQVLGVDPEIVTQLRKGYEAHISVDQVEKPSLSLKWRERTEIWIARLDLEYENGRVSISQAINAFQKLAALGVDLDGLSAPKKLDIQTRGSKVDREIEKLLGEFPADNEEDLPL